MQQLKLKCDRIGKQHTFLLWVTLISFLCALFFSTNVLWMVPFISAFMGTHLAKSDIHHLNIKIIKCQGHYKEEYW